MKIKSLITHPMLYQPRKTFVRLQTQMKIFLIKFEVDHYHTGCLRDQNLTAHTQKNYMLALIIYFFHQQVPHNWIMLNKYNLFM